MEERDLDAFVSMKLINTYYLSGFTSLDTMRSTSYTRPIVVVVDHTGAALIVPTVGEEAAQAMSAIRDIRSYGTSPVKEVAQALTFDRLAEVGARRVGVEQDAITGEWLAAWDKRLPETEVVFAGDLVEQLRMRKDEGEIDLMRHAAALADAAIRAGMNASTPGSVELAAETKGIVALRDAAADNGEAAMIDSISGVLSGPRGSMPHELSSGRVIKHGELFWHVWLVAYRGYWIENVRTGVATAGECEHERVHAVAEEALMAGQEAARPGAVASDVFAAVMGVLKRDEIPGAVILSRSGHGSGLEYHEPPFMEETDHTPLEPGIVLTVEPGIWMPGIGGATLSNTLVVREGGAEILNDTPTGLWRTAE
jgi:Xaa-Pro aminopeptidase